MQILCGPATPGSLLLMQRISFSLLLFQLSMSYIGKEENSLSSLFILNDVTGNKISNINIVAESNINNTSTSILLIRRLKFLKQLARTLSVLDLV